MNTLAIIVVPFLAGLVFGLILGLGMWWIEERIKRQ